MDDFTKKAVERSVQLLKKVQEVEKTRHSDGVSYFTANDIASRTANLIQSIAGPKSSYAESLRLALKNKTALTQYLAVSGVLQAFHIDLANGDLANIRHEVETIVVSEMLAQAKKLLKTKGIHPAASIIVSCAAVEEFLRNWCNERSISVPDKSRSLGNFALALRQDGAIQLPVERRIQSWADYRNNAAHGDKWNSITPDIAKGVIKEIEDFLLENRTVFG